jgi:transposase
MASLEQGARCAFIECDLGDAMMAKRKNQLYPKARRAKGVVSGQRARKRAGSTLLSHRVGAIPLLKRIMERMHLEQLLDEHILAQGRRPYLSTAKVLSILVCNLLESREPMYGVAEWASHYAPDLFGLEVEDLEHLNDDRVGRCLDRVFVSLDSELVMSVVRQVVQEFDVSLDELHNDSTTISFFGSYGDAQQEGLIQNRLAPAIIWGHSKDHRPDLKQLLYTLTVTEDGGIPIYFQVDSGNLTDDQTHQMTWQLMRELVNRPDFVYVADCKLATTENMNAIARQGGRFITILPATRKENTQFRQRLREQPQTVTWREVYQLRNEEKEVLDTLSVCSDDMLSAEGFRLHWILSTRKKENDAATRVSVTDRAVRHLVELRQRILGPRTRFRQRDKVEQAVREILDKYGVQDWMVVEIHESEKEIYQQERRGRPGKNTKYKRTVQNQYTLCWQIDTPTLLNAAKDDGVFPLITNLHDWDARKVLEAYKRQPIIEKRFSQLKTDFCVAPVYLKNVGRIVGLLAVYFFALIVQTLLERELRRAMKEQRLATLPLYPEGRPCARPTTRQTIDVFENIQRHTIQRRGAKDEVIVTDLSPLQRQVLQLLKLVPTNYGA